jgi:hypothetical protein
LYLSQSASYVHFDQKPKSSRKLLEEVNTVSNDLLNENTSILCRGLSVAQLYCENIEVWTILSQLWQYINMLDDRCLTTPVNVNSSPELWFLGRTAIGDVRGEDSGLLHSKAAVW